MDLGNWLTAGGLLVAALSLVVALRKDTRGDARSQGEQMAMLTSINNGVDDIRLEQRTMRDRADKQGTELAGAGTRLPKASSLWDWGRTQRSLFIGSGSTPPLAEKLNIGLDTHPTCPALCTISDLNNQGGYYLNYLSFSENE